MVLVDTSVWIDFLTGHATREAEGLVSLLENRESIAFTGNILQELMQGCENDAKAKLIESRFEPFIEIFPRRSSYNLASQIFRKCRKRGHTIRSSIDCLIAACAIENNCAVLYRDRDFKWIGQVSTLKIL